MALVSCFPSILDPTFLVCFSKLYPGSLPVLCVYLMSTRRKHRLDYTVYSKTGRKVFKEGGEANMATSEVRELQVVGEINHNIELYNLDELISED